MRKWVGGLHGGQLVMLLGALAGIGVVLLNAGNKLLADSSAMGRSIYAMKDTTGNGVLLQSVRRDATMGLRAIGIAVLLWLAALVLLWIWFGTRKRPVSGL